MNRRDWRSKALAAAFATTLLTTGCGARTDLDGATDEGGAGLGAGGNASSHGGTGAGTPTPGIYVADIDNKRIVRFDDASGSGWVEQRADFNVPSGIALDSRGRIYVTDVTRIVRMDDMNAANLVSFSGEGAHRFRGVFAIAIDRQDRIYVADAGANRIVRIDDISGAGWVALGGPAPGSAIGEFTDPWSVAVSPEGHILVGDNRNFRVVEMNDMSGAGWTTWRSAIGARTFSPGGVAYDAEGRLLVADFDNSLLYQLDDISGSGAQALQTEEQLLGVAAEANGHVWMTLYNAAEVVLEWDGTSVPTVVGNHGSGVDAFGHPAGIAVVGSP